MPSESDAGIDSRRPVAALQQAQIAIGDEQSFDVEDRESITERLVNGAKVDVPGGTVEGTLFIQSHQRCALPVRLRARPDREQGTEGMGLERRQRRHCLHIWLLGLASFGTHWQFACEEADKTTRTAVAEVEDTKAMFIVGNDIDMPSHQRQAAGRTQVLDRRFAGWCRHLERAKDASVDHSGSVSDQGPLIFIRSGLRRVCTSFGTHQGISPS